MTQTNRTNSKNSARIGFVFVMALLMAICMAPAVNAADRSTPHGIKDVEVETYQVPGQMTLQEDANYPSEFDPRLNKPENTWFNQACQVEDQGDTELCWAFSATTAAELSWSKENFDAGRPLQTPPQLSPVHLAYYFYNWPGDPLEGTDGDSNNTTRSDNWIDEGGNQLWVMQHLANQADCIQEEEMPFILDSNDRYAGPIEYDPDECYRANTVVLQDSEFHKDLQFDGGRDVMKSMIMKYGAVMGAICFDFNYFDDNHVNFYFPIKGEDTNHAVTVVGWNDNYPKSLFKPVSGSLPEEDGAWLVQNSHGSLENQNGFIWVSYESVDLMGSPVVSVDMEQAKPSEQIDVLQYDGNSNYSVIKMDPDEIAANVFTLRGRVSETLDRVGFTSANEGHTEYVIRIYTGLDDTDEPTYGTLALEQEVSTEVPGYHTFDLDKEIKVNAGESFSVCVGFKSETYFGVERTKGKDFTANIEPEQSYYLFRDSGEWVDASNKDDQMCFRIKAMGTPEMCPGHNWLYVRTIKPQKGKKGYDVFVCEYCSILGTGNETPALKPVPNKTSLTKLVRAKKAMTVKWKKSTEKILGKFIDGYQIRYSLKKSMKGAKTVTVKGYNVSSKKIKKLKAKKKYFVQIRTFKKTDGKMYYSGWSAKKAVKTK